MGVFQSSRLAAWVHRVAGGFFIMAALAAVIIGVFSLFSLAQVMMPGSSSATLPVEVSFTSVDTVAPTSDAFESAELQVSRGFIVAGQGNVLAWVLLMFPFWIQIGLLFGILYYLRGFTGDLLAGRPFARENARRIRLIGVILIVGQLLQAVAGAGVLAYARSHFSLDGGSINHVPEINLMLILLGGFLMVVGEAFRLGSQLQQEREETI